MCYLLWGQVLHTPGDLISAGHQVFKCQSFVWDLTGVKWVVHPRRPSCPQIFPKIPFRGIFYQHIQRTCMNTVRNNSVRENQSRTSKLWSYVCACTDHLVCTLPASWWCFCVFQSSSSSPFQTQGPTGPYLCHHLRKQLQIAILWNIITI